MCVPVEIAPATVCSVMNPTEGINQVVASCA